MTGHGAIASIGSVSAGTGGSSPFSTASHHHHHHRSNAGTGGGAANTGGMTPTSHHHSVSATDFQPPYFPPPFPPPPPSHHHHQAASPVAAQGHHQLDYLNSVTGVTDPYSQTLNSLHQTAQAAAAAHHYNQLTAAAVSAGQRTTTTHDVLRRDSDALHVVSNTDRLRRKGLNLRRGKGPLSKRKHTNCVCVFPCVIVKSVHISDQMEHRAGLLYRR